MTQVAAETEVGVPDMQGAALAWHDGGFCVVRARINGTKAPVGEWARHQATRPTREQVQQWFGGNHPGVGVICGKVSDGLEMFELEGRAVVEGARDRLLPVLRNAGVFDIWRRLVGGYAEWTPSGGLHLLFRIADHDVPGNTKIASRPARDDELTDDERDLLARQPNKVITRTLAETRGEGGFVVVAPSHGPTHETGRPWALCDDSRYGQVPTITWAQRNALYDVVRVVLDETPEPEPATGHRPAPERVAAGAGEGDRPGDHWARQASWADILEPHGWTWVHRNGDMDYWRRPGKQIGISARTGGRFDGLYVWSTSTEFPAEVHTTKFRAYSILEHRGSDQAAGTELRRRGFGADRPLVAGRERDWAAADHDRDDDWPDVDGPIAAGWEPGAVKTDAVNGPGNRDDPFWTSRAELMHVRDLARERHVSPWATLGAVLAHVCTRIGPHVVLPPTVGGVASLNTFWALVGASGGGKDAALAVALELLVLDDDIPAHEVGTGQGIDSAYTTQTKGGPVQFCDSALFTMTEIDSLAGHAAMSGSTTMATLRKVYSGSALGARYADKTKRRPVRQHRYRAAVVAGVQPARSAVLLGDSDGGTPQRWIWLPTNDPGIGEHTAPDARPESAPATHWQYEYLTAYGEMDGDEPVPQRRRVEIKVCDAARETIIECRRAMLARPLVSEDGDDLNGHALLTRLKIAALLALYNGGRTEVTDDDWHLSEYVMQVSDATRDACVRALAATARKANVAKARQEIERSDIAADHALRRVSAALLRVLRRAGDWVTRAELRRRLSGTDRGFFDAAIERLRAAGQVDEEESDRGTKYRCATE